MLSVFLTLLATRLTYLLPILAAALLVGEPWARALQFPRLRLSIGSIIARLNRKLNRPQRSVAVRLYRGMVALSMLLIPALVIGIALLRDQEWIALLATLLMIALLGELVGSWRHWRLWRAAKRGTMTLQSTTPHFMFADTHALLRYRIREAACDFTLLIGSSIYFLLADIPGTLLYLMLAAAARYYTPAIESNRAFGWSAAGLFALVNWPIQLVAGFLLWLAAWFTPRTHPFRALMHRPKRFDGWVANLTGLSLGGLLPSPAGELNLPWVGTGTPKPVASDLGRAMQLLLAGLLLWICLLGSSYYLLHIDN